MQCADAYILTVVSFDIQWCMAQANSGGKLSGTLLASGPGNFSLFIVLSHGAYCVIYSQHRIVAVFIVIRFW